MRLTEGKARVWAVHSITVTPKVKPSDGTVVVPAGSLDTPLALRPVAHICMDSKADWDNALETVPKLPGMPG